MGKLAAALSWAARGLRVFPVQVDSRDPLDIPWTEMATKDPEQIRALWTCPVTGFELENNIGFLTSDHIVCDVDVKAGKPGLQSLAHLGLDFDTLTTRTPSGGYHLIYKKYGQEPIGQSPIAQGIDIRSHNGYVLAPGSTIGGKPYVVELDQPLVEFPAHLRHLLRSPRERRESPLFRHVDLDTPELIELCAHWLLLDAPVAVEGQNGDLTTYKVATRLRDFGLSEHAAFDLMLDEYNPRCEPPWPPETLAVKVQNAYRYATGDAGSAAPAAAFGTVQPVEQANGHAVPAGLFGFGNMLDMEAIEARPWIVSEMLMARVVSTLIGAGGAGKSIFILTLAAHLAVGVDFIGSKMVRPGKSIIYNAEDDLKEASMRLHAICDAYGLDKKIVRESIALVSSEDLGLKITQSKPVQVNQAQVDAVVAAARDPLVQLVAVDPLAEIHTANENDNMEMNYVMGILRVIARQADVAVLAAVHTGKPPKGSSIGYAGDQNAGRGASSVPAAARVVLTLFGAADADCEGAGISPAEKHLFVRLDGAKANFAAATGQSRWMRWHEREMLNGDKVGVLLAHDARSAYARMTQEIADALIVAIQKQGLATMTGDQALEAVREVNDLYRKEETALAKKRLTRLLEAGVHGSGNVRVHGVREGHGFRVTIG